VSGSAAQNTLVDRLAALPNLAAIPRQELSWLAAHGEQGLHQAGQVVAPAGQRIEKMWILLSGHIAVNVDRGAGPRRVIDWHTGDVSGMLPYSRMKGPPGDNFFVEPTELLTIHERHFPEMIRECPTFTAYTVHLMLDRARGFNSSDMQDEKMISLGKLAAGLAHELNNPASAALRGAKRLKEGLVQSDRASRALGAAALPPDIIAAIEQARSACVGAPGGVVLSALQQADREDAIGVWLDGHGVDSALAAPLADTAVTLDALDTFARTVPASALTPALQWIAAGCTAQALATDVEQAATRIHELVSAIKGFTHMDQRASPEVANVAAGLRDTIRVVAAKAKAKGAAVSFEATGEIPRVRANAGELNQVWLNLIDNALDAIPDGGRVDVTAARERDNVVVRIVDNGSGIPANVLPWIFDPFFTTKPPGQGTGLGLDITRRLVRRYQGDIEVESQPGRTEFRVTLVVVPDEPAAGA
jgi:signal transduction histidine kinase